MKNKQLPRDDRSFGFAECSKKLILSAINRDYRRCRKSRGRNYRLGPVRMFELFASRLRYNDPFSRLARDFGVSKSSAYRIYRRVLKIADSLKAFELPAVSDLKPGSYVVDATVFQVTRPGGNAEQKRFYSGKHKKHCSKAQIIIRKGSMAPETVTFTRFGSVHDYKLFKRMEPKIPEGVLLDGDNGYQGMQNLVPGSRTPKKKPRGGELSEEDKAFNRELSSKRIIIEHVNSFIKRFEILGGRYRGRRDRLERIVKFIAGVCRFEKLSEEQAALLFRMIYGTTLLSIKSVLKKE